MTQCNRSDSGTQCQDKKHHGWRRAATQAAIVAATLAALPLVACQTATAEPPASQTTLQLGDNDSLVLADLQSAALQALKNGELDTTGELIEQAAANRTESARAHLRPPVTACKAVSEKFV
ncbi:MAG: hypothetical protein AAGD32_07760, partial [Planctomycetota bacterium]